MFGTTSFLFLFSFAFATEVIPREFGVASPDKGLPKPTISSSQELEDTTKLCFFGQFPSGSCRFHCYMKKLSAFCNEEGVCQCKEEEDETRKPLQNITTSNDNTDEYKSPQNFTEEEEAAPPLMFYILHFIPLHSDDNMTATPTTASSLPTTTKPLPSTARSWTSPLVLTVLVLLILTVLVLLELVVCCKRRHTHLINVRPGLTPPVCEKAPMG